MADTDNSNANPFRTLIDETEGKPSLLQDRYERHRTNRNQQQRHLLASDDFQGFNVDQILRKLTAPELYPGYVDPRHCITLWARPPKHIQEIVAYVQKELRAVAPNLWMMPAPNLHATVIEVVHSKTESEIDEIRRGIESSKGLLTDVGKSSRCRLIKPLVSFDASALALSFVPAAEDPTKEQTASSDTYSYHHFREERWEKCRDAGLQVASRYVVPSAHLTIARFVSQEGFKGRDPQNGGVNQDAVAELLATLEQVNEHLRVEYWPDEAGQIPESGEWWVGQDVGLTLRYGMLWYGGGESIHVGKGY